jgi:hypothetical protein
MSQQSIDSLLATLKVGLDLRGLGDPRREQWQTEIVGVARPSAAEVRRTSGQRKRGVRMIEDQRGQSQDRFLIGYSLWKSSRKNAEGI